MEWWLILIVGYIVGYWCGVCTEKRCRKFRDRPYGGK